MSNRTSAEIRLSLSDLIANTIYEFVDHDAGTPADEREQRIAIEDAAESILGILGIVIKDGLNEDNEIQAILSREIPEEFSL